MIPPGGYKTRNYANRSVGEIGFCILTVYAEKECHGPFGRSWTETDYDTENSICIRRDTIVRFGQVAGNREHYFIVVATPEETTFITPMDPSEICNAIKDAREGFKP